MSVKPALNIKLNPREQVLVIVSLLAVVLFVLVQFVVRPLRADEAGLDLKIEKLSRQLRKAEAQSSRVPVVSRAYSAWAGAFGQDVPDDQTASALTSSMQDKARSFGLTVGNVQPAMLSEQSPVKVYRLNMDLSGSAPDVVSFLAAIEASPIYGVIEQASLRPTSNDNLSASVVVSFLRIPKQ